MPAGRSISNSDDDTITGRFPTLTRRQFLRTGTLAAASFLLPSVPAQAASEGRFLPVPFRYQRHALTCEIATLRMAAEYYGEVWAEDEMLRMTPMDRSQPRDEEGTIVWADPNHSFPGNFRGWQLYQDGLEEHPERARRGHWGYGIHAPVIAEVAVCIGLAAEVFDVVEAVYAAIDRRRVPIVIVPDSGRDQAIIWQWHTPQGRAVTVMNAEHSVVVRGYDDHTVWVNDPVGKIQTYARDRFERAFALMSQGVTIGPARRVTPKVTPR